jgi:4-hydroxy-tetrahydrodipicolinate synthase
MLKKSLFHGINTALVTPFKNHQIDYISLENLIQEQITSNVSNIVVHGTTGENPTLSLKEKLQVIEFVIEKAQNKINIIVGVGNNNTLDTIEQVKNLSKFNIDALLVTTPYYNKPTQEGLYQHFKAIAENTNKPIMLYNIVGRTGVNIDVSTLTRLSKIQNIKAVKESSGNMAQIMELLSLNLPEFSIVAGDDALFYPTVHLGAVGVVSVMSNVFPNKMEELYQCFINKKYTEALALHNELLPLINALFIESNPLPVKTVLHLQGKIAEEFRLPLTTMQAQNKDKLKDIFKI